MLFAEDWNFDAQPITPVSFKLEPSDDMIVRCTYRNDGEMPLVYGESSDNEMCVLVLYYAPASTAQGCVKK